MKYINFITTLSPQQQREIRLWYIITCILITTTLITAGIIVVPQAYELYCTYQTLRAAQHKASHYSQTNTTHTALKKEQEDLQKKYTKITTYTSGVKNPLSLISAVLQHCSHEIRLEYIKKHKKQYDISIMCNTPEQATDFINRLLNSSHFTTLKLVSLHHNTQDKTIRCIIKGQ